MITAGILAHVDAGKTTLSESLLLETGVIKKAGRVDSKDAFLDNDQVERERGITIYSKNARLPLENIELILIDTPGHVDFSTETERALSVLDVAILLISGPAGIQPHTKTLWSLLKLYKIPTVLFVNKMDMNGADASSILNELSTKLSGSISAISENDFENVASLNEKMMNEYLETGSVSRESISEAFWNRQLFPVFFGSALKHQGIDTFIDGLQKLLQHKIVHEMNNLEDFSGVVYKISHDNQGRRLTFLKILSGSLKVKSLLGEEKINEIRIYSGEKYNSVSEVTAGDICAISGLNNTHAGDRFGNISKAVTPVLSPAISYALIYPDEIDKGQMLEIMNILGDEDPSLNVTYNEETREIQVSLMGDIQTEILKRTLSDRFNIKADFGEGKICYKETIDASCIGVGHFEPLRHYAEVHLKMEPLERGQGLEFASDVSEDLLDKNWQRLIMTHLKERIHRGVLLGAPVTDMRFTIVAGKAHIKHTEGGDFRQATYRAIRQGLMMLLNTDNCRLLEPYYDYTLKLPENYVGRAMTDISAMSGTCNIAENDITEGLTILTGRAPVSAMNGYMKEVMSYSKGLGHLEFSVAGYDICHNEEEVLQNSSYNPDNDTRNPSSSVFCSHGAGTIIPWDQVPLYKHVDYDGKSVTDRSDLEMINKATSLNNARKNFDSTEMFISTEEIDSILKQNSHANENGRKGSYKGISSAVRNRARENNKITAKDVTYKGTTYKEKYMLVDGYNVIHAWSSLEGTTVTSLDAAAGSLNDILSNYQAITGVNLIVVYDAYKVKGHKTEEIPLGNITVVYTRESQTADQYIERYANQNASKYDITVVTSDGLEQIIIRGEGCHLISSREFKEHIDMKVKNFNEKHGVK